ncbi:MAG: phosphate ABC transporter substrate-binding protein [Dolichospermum sp. DEX189]|uniref:Substrate-binding domain-containing protein n=1 Tax=Aphanizomenon flos-aquae FACHB-1040 TaxID=2692887 RepID=A0ABR8C1Y8_APHFL|nr:substrate-binding domain-containing protein [Aphanizomenon flos-aquae]MBD2281143.1 substrate-binding domain-containing protein [Aphanizomenon flos-aquae FACHB-1040]MBO1071825.1 phosphate ABC transporter substrate-binding protein [Dolichospermum sp. DEX189]
MTADYNFNNVKCPKCGHDQNAVSAKKCEICGHQLKKSPIPPIVFVGLTALVAVGGGYFAFKGKLTGKTTPELTTTAPNTTVPAVPIPQPTATQEPPAPNTETTTAAINPTSTNSANIDTSLPNPTILSMDGSTTMVGLIQRLRNAYSQINANIPTTYGQPNGFPKGSGKGLEALMKNVVVIAATSRPLKPTEAQAGIQVIAIARDAVGVVVGVNNPFQGSLTLDQLQQIYQGKITNWSQVGGPNASIKVINRAASSGTRDFFQDTVLLEKPFAPDSANFITFPQDETTGIIRILGNNGISYATVSQLENQQLVRIIPINEVSPVDKTAIQSGKYPISRSVYLAIRKQNSPAVKQFIDLALSSQGQQIIQQSGFIPLQ